MDYKFDASHFALIRPGARKEGWSGKEARAQRGTFCIGFVFDEENVLEEASENVVENCWGFREKATLEVVEKMCENVVVETQEHKKPKAKKATKKAKRQKK